MSTPNRNAYLLRKYGITFQDYERLFAFQGKVCAICGRPPKPGGRSLAVDHDHRTGKVRGLLCYLCNARVLSRGRDDLTTLRNAVKYLERPPAASCGIGQREKVNDVSRRAASS